MPQVVDGLELKMRGFEAPRRRVFGADHLTFIDGELAGPGSMTPADFVGGGQAALPVNPNPVTGPGVNPLIPITRSDVNGPITELFSLPDIMAGYGSLYLGPHATPPITDNFGQPLKVGHSYYNTSDGVNYTWSTAGVWASSLQPVSSGLRVYYYNFPVPSSSIPPGGGGQADAHGNVLSFDLSAGQAATDAVQVYINGVLLTNGADYVVQEGGSGGDTIGLAVPYCAGSTVIVSINAASGTQFLANALSANTTAWVCDNSNKTFPLIDFAGNPLVPRSGANCIVSINNIVQNPVTDYVIVGSAITFVVPPPFNAEVWVTVGIPVSESAGSFVQPISPYDHGGVGNSSADDTNALALSIIEMLGTGRPIDLSGGSWRVTGALPVMHSATIVGAGEIYVDWDGLGKPILEISPPLLATYDVSAIDIVPYTFTPGAAVTNNVIRLTLVTPGALPPVGSVCKITASNALPDAAAGNSVGNDTGLGYVYCPMTLLDSYTTAIQLHQLDEERSVDLRGFKMRANWDALVSFDWRVPFIQINGAVKPRCTDLRFEDGTRGIVLAGCWLASTRGLRTEHMRNAPVSETPPINGDGVVDSGSFMSIHTDCGGSDAGHIYTTAVAPSTSPRVTWGRAVQPRLLGGQASSCSSAAYDAGPSCWEPSFSDLGVTGGYYGESASGAGIRLRGTRGRATGCKVRDCPIGFEIYQQYDTEGGNHALDGCEYNGTGTPVRFARDAGLSAAPKQTLRIRDFYGETYASAGIDVSACDVVIEGLVRIVTRGSLSGTQAIFLRAASTVRSYGDGRLALVCAAMTGTPGPNLIVFTGPNCGAAGLNGAIRAGSVAWNAVVAESDGPTAAVAGAFRIDCDADIAGAAASGGYSLNGAGNLLTAGALQLILTVNNARTQAAKTSAFSLTTAMNRQTLLCSGAYTITVPAPAVLGPDFACAILSTTGNIVLDGPGATNLTIPSGSLARLVAVGAGIYANIATQTILT
jgi:hypothetical protein